MIEYSINTKTRGTITTVILIVSIFIGLLIQIFFNNIVPENYKDNLLLLFLELFIIPSVLGIAGFIKIIISKWLWRIQWVNKIIGIPNLNGEWDAVGESDHNGGTKFYGKICIIQTMTKIKIIGDFNQSKSFNTLTYIKIDDDGSFELSYHYENIPKPNMKETMNKHCGYMYFTGQKNDDLNGEYFNDRFRGTRGVMTLRKIATTNCSEPKEKVNKL